MRPNNSTTAPEPNSNAAEPTANVDTIKVPTIAFRPVIVVRIAVAEMTVMSSHTAAISFRPNRSRDHQATAAANASNADTK